MRAARVDVLPDANVEVHATLVKESRDVPWYKRWYVWAAVGVVVSGVAIGAAVAATAEHAPNGTLPPGKVSLGRTKGNDVVITLPLGHWTAPTDRRAPFPVIARTSGTFAMTITLESADGSLPLGQPTRVTIRSAVFSGIGIALTLGALVFLAGWWGNHFWRTRRARRRALAA